MKKLSSILILVLFMASCSESNEETPNSDVITGYKITATSDYDDSGISDYKRIVTGVLVNGKLHTETSEAFINNISTGAPITNQKYFYTNDLLTQVNLGGNFVDYFYYNTQNQLIGVSRIYTGGQTLNYRFIHQTTSTVYCERINLPYNDPSATASSRMILNFDADNNVISAGYDNDFDGAITNLFTFTYVNDNLTSILKPDGSTETYNFSNVIDSMNRLREASYGKKVMRMICSENYCGGNVNDLDYSKNINSLDVISETYETLPNNYYNKRTKIIELFNPDGEFIEETEFFF